MLNVTRENSDWVIKFKNDEVSFEFLSILLKKARIERLLEESEMTEAFAEKLSEEIKESWWKKNKETFTENY